MGWYSCGSGKGPEEAQRSKARGPRPTSLGPPELLSAVPDARMRSSPQVLWARIQASVLPQRPFGGFLLQLGLRTVASWTPCHWAGLWCSLHIIPGSLVPGPSRKKGERAWEARGGAHDLVSKTDAAQMGELRNSDCRHRGCVRWEPAAPRLTRLPGRAWEAAVLGRCWEALQRPGPSARQLSAVMVTQAWQSSVLGSICLGSLPASWCSSAAGVPGLSAAIPTKCSSRTL